MRVDQISLFKSQKQDKKFKLRAWNLNECDGENMEFCPKDGMRLIPKPKTKGKTKVNLVCPKCGYEKEVTSKTATTPKTIEHGPEEQIAIIGKEISKLKTMPTTKIECPKCGNTEAYCWMVQTRGSDESPTQFFRCTRCSHTWREYS